MQRQSRNGRRVWVYLGRGVSCAVWTCRGPHGRVVLTSGVRAYDINCYRRMSNAQADLEVDRGRQVARLVSGNVVYAFYCRSAHAVKIGRTTDIRKRWAQLENQSGQVRQLLAVWQCPDTRDLEHELHQRWLQHRTMGEWFAADPVLADLREIYAESRKTAA